MLIDSSYFTTGPRHIQNATMGNALLPNANSVEVCKAIEGYISYFQEEYLAAMLGHTLGNKVNAYLVCKDEDATTKAVESYDAVCAQLKESFADYVFFHILRYSQSQATITGFVRLKCANNYVSPILRQVQIWNKMVVRNQQILSWYKSPDCALEGVCMSEEMLTKINSLNL